MAPAARRRPDAEDEYEGGLERNAGGGIHERLQPRHAHPGPVGGLRLAGDGRFLAGFGAADLDRPYGPERPLQGGAQPAYASLRLLAGGPYSCGDQEHYRRRHQHAREGDQEQYGVYRGHQRQRPDEEQDATYGVDQAGGEGRAQQGCVGAHAG